ncbi:MAG: response regulator transcription factor [Planctomycetes bacterium]|nr:response regulator transcription factor [Planctomycetota bacterium]MCP4771705.1 response regulator transcription factor [Planctomycetota bacterium]MCP4859995.1 response regulator transcription factor [Planctomycetota bacterium]
MKKRRILIIEDEERIAFWVRSFFVKAGYEAEAIGDGQAGLNAIMDSPPDLVILDRMLPGLDGIAVLQKLRKFSTVPVILLTALGAEEQRVEGLRAGADDYLVKPFSPEELLARSEAVLRRVYDGGHKEITIGAIHLNLETRSCAVRKQPVELSRTQFDLLATMMQQPDRVFRRNELLEAAFDRDFDGYDRAVDVQMRRLRERLEVNPADPLLIVTVHGVGYRFQGEQA